MEGGLIVDAPETVTAGDVLEVEPASRVEEITLIWDTGQDSTLLTNAPVTSQTPFEIEGESFDVESLEEETRTLDPEENLRLTVTELTELTVVATADDGGEGFDSVEAERECSDETLTISNDGTESLVVSFEPVEVVDDVNNDCDGFTATGPE